MATPAIPNLPLWRLHLMLDEAERRTKRLDEELKVARSLRDAIQEAIRVKGLGPSVMQFKDTDKGWSNNAKLPQRP